METALALSSLIDSGFEQKLKTSLVFIDSLQLMTLSVMIILCLSLPY